MAIRTIVTRGYGNGTFDGSIALVSTRGYSIGEAIDDVIIDTINLVLYVARTGSSNGYISRSLSTKLYIEQSVNLGVEG